MFFQLLSEHIINKEDKKIYSLGMVVKNTSHNTFTIKYNDFHCKIYTHEILNPGEWIRFVGMCQEGIINTEYTEVLHNIDINLLKRAMYTLNEQNL